MLCGRLWHALFPWLREGYPLVQHAQEHEK
jgi:hypothetical protein